MKINWRSLQIRARNILIIKTMNRFDHSLKDDAKSFRNVQTATQEQRQEQRTDGTLLLKDIKFKISTTIQNLQVVF